MSRADSRRSEIISTAREICENKGLDGMRIQDITSKVGVTRSLFYHYFDDKDALINAMLDDMVNEYIQLLEVWNANREQGNIDAALKSIVQVLRLGVFEDSDLHRTLATNGSASLYLDLVNRVAHHTASYIIETTVQDYSALHEVEIEHLYETFYVLIVGVIGYLRTHPDADDSVVADVIAQTLHLDRTTR